MENRYTRSRHRHVEAPLRTQLQAIVDSLGHRLRRAVALDDASMRLQVYSSHHGQVDPVRLASILHREAPAEAVKWVLSLGISRADRPVRLPTNPNLQMESRVCIPIRAQGLLLGYLWLIDSDSSLTDDELEVAAAAADEAATLIYQEQLVSQLARGRARELLRDLLSEDVEVRRHAAHELLEESLFVPAAPAVMVVVSPTLPEGAVADNHLRMSLDAALDRVRRQIPPRNSLYLVRPDHGLLLLATTKGSLGAEGIHQVTNEIIKNLGQLLGQVEVVVGVGERQEFLHDAVISYRQAQEAVRVARIVPSFGSVVAWSQLGIYRMLSQFPLEHLTSGVLHPGLTRLFQTRDADTLASTLECYLDSACDAKATSEALCLHRASLYYRLQKIETVTGASLKDGEERLALHLGLKLARLAGIRSDNEVPRTPKSQQPSPVS